MNLLGETILTWFEKHAPKGGTGRDLDSAEGAFYLTQYHKAAADLNAFVHGEVTKGAIARDGGYLTDHGPDHIATVIRRASELLDGAECTLTLYEAYLLLAAIHFHDVGNAFGRSKHEEMAQKAMTFLGEAIGRDQLEKRIILKIARAHGGDIAGDKDTIGPLPKDTSINNRTVRPRLLAAILRLADELADQRQRASRFMLDTNAIPPQARIFHEYAHALHSIEIDHVASTIRLGFDVDASAVHLQYPYRDNQVYLFDYILERTLKMHFERLYCMRFLQPHMTLTTIDVRVEVHGHALDPLEAIGYRLVEQGYPSAPEKIYDLCSELRSNPQWNGVRVDGATLAGRIVKGDLP